MKFAEGRDDSRRLWLDAHTELVVARITETQMTFHTTPFCCSKSTAEIASAGPTDFLEEFQSK
jgi:hypothetical protein